MTDTSAALDQIHPYAPAGYGTLTPYLVVPDGAAAIAFYEQAFGAEVLTRMDGEGDVVLHAELRIGDSVLQLSNAMPDVGLVAPAATRTGSFVLYVPDVDAAHAAAVAAGAKPVSQVEDVFSGDRIGIVNCPSGHRWVIMTRVEHLSDAEIAERARAWMAAGGEHPSE